VVDASVNLATESAQIHYFTGTTSVADITALTKDAGYPGNVKPSQQSGQQPGNSNEAIDRKAAVITRLGKQTLLALLLALPVVVIEMGSHLIPAVRELISNTIGMQRGCSSTLREFRPY